MNEDFELINYSRPIREISEVDDSEVLNQLLINIFPMKLD